jgi:hypothetical protein
VAACDNRCERGPDAFSFAPQDAIKNKKNTSLGGCADTHIKARVSAASRACEPSRARAHAFRAAQVPAVGLSFVVERLIRCSVQAALAAERARHAATPKVPAPLLRFASAMEE